MSLVVVEKELFLYVIWELVLKIVSSSNVTYIKSRPHIMSDIEVVSCFAVFVSHRSSLQAL